MNDRLKKKWIRKQEKSTEVKKETNNEQRERKSEGKERKKERKKHQREKCNESLFGWILWHVNPLRLFNFNPVCAYIRYMI